VAICAQHFVPSSEEGSRIQLTHSKRASRASAVPHGTAQRDAGSVYHWHLQPLLYGPAHFVMTCSRLYRIHNYSTSLSRVDINALSTLWGVR
jgi:hypothetical protein